MDDEQILAFRLARSGLAGPPAPDLAAAAACPASDFARDAALLALAARTDGLTREAYDAAVDAGEVVVAHAIRGAIHALAPTDHALLGRALVARDDEELGRQLGRQVRRLAEEHGFRPTAALREVAEATADALTRGRRLDKNALHEALRERVRPELMPWCEGCGSHHVAPMLWRYATVRAGVRLDAARRYRAGSPGRAPKPAEAARRYLRFYGPGTAAGFAEWAGLARSHAERLWTEVAPEVGPSGVLEEDEPVLASPPQAEGVRLLPAGDPYLQGPNRPLLAPDRALRSRLFRSVASPGAVLKDGRLVGLWKARARGRRTEVAVEKLGRVAKADLEPAAARVAALRGAGGLELVVS